MASPVNNPQKPDAQIDAALVYMRPAKYSDDMDDTGDLECLDIALKNGNRLLEPMASAIRVVQEAIYDRYVEFDQKAVTNRKHFTRFAIIAVVSGLSSVCFAVIEMTKFGAFIPAWYGELLAVTISLFCIAFGTAFHFKGNWILSRYKAERLRLLKFAKLTDPALWCDPPDLSEAEAELQIEVRKICDERYEDAKIWSSEGVIPHTAAPPCKDRCREALRELVQYYIPKRLDIQTSYLERKSDVVERWGSVTSTAMQWIFFGSFAFVLVHLIGSYPHRSPAAYLAPQRMETSAPASTSDSPATAAANQEQSKPATKPQQESEDDGPPWEGYFAFLALFLPIVAAGLRTYRGANEYERTASRHRATLTSLLALSEQLSQTRDLDKQFELIGFCELVLEADCREFLRLVSEAEWYG